MQGLFITYGKIIPCENKNKFHTCSEHIMIRAKNTPQRGTLVTRSFFAVMTITSVEDLNLRGFQDNDLSQDQISYCSHGKTQIYLWANIQRCLLCLPYVQVSY